MSNRALGLLAGGVGVLAIVVIALFALVALGGGDDDDDPTIPGSGDDNGNDDGDGSASGICSGNTFVTYGSDPLSRFDPIQVRDETTAEYVVEIFGGLVRLDQDLQVAGDLAETWDISPDGLTYTFHLREGIVFHNETRVTADDVKYSLERAADPENASPTAELYLSGIAGFLDKLNGEAEEIEGVTVIDERTVEIRLDAPRSYFLAELTYPVAYVVDQEQIESNPDGWTTQPNGTGPYRLRTFRPAERIELVRNERYHLGVPAIENVVFELAGGSISTRYENGELAVGAVPVLELESYQDGSAPLADEYRPTPQMAVIYIQLNPEQPPFDDPLVRQALALAIDRDAINDARLFGAWRVADGIVPPETPGYNEATTSYEFDPERARELLAQSSYADDMPRIIITAAGTAAAPPAVLEAIAGYWSEELGVEIEIQNADPATFLRELRSGNLQSFLAGWIADYPDPEDFLDKLFYSESVQNENNYSNPDVDALLLEARGELDDARRFELYAQAEQIIVDDAAILPLYWPVDHLLVKPCVQGWRDLPMIVPRYQYLSFDESQD